MQTDISKQDISRQSTDGDNYRVKDKIFLEKCDNFPKQIISDGSPMPDVRKVVDETLERVAPFEKDSFEVSMAKQGSPYYSAYKDFRRDITFNKVKQDLGFERDMDKTKMNITPAQQEMLDHLKDPKIPLREKVNIHESIFPSSSDSQIFKTPETHIMSPKAEKISGILKSAISEDGEHGNVSNKIYISKEYFNLEALSYSGENGYQDKIKKLDKWKEDNADFLNRFPQRDQLLSSWQSKIAANCAKYQGIDDVAAVLVGLVSVPAGIVAAVGVAVHNEATSMGFTGRTCLVVSDQNIKTTHCTYNKMEQAEIATYELHSSEGEVITISDGKIDELKKIFREEGQGITTSEWNDIKNSLKMEETKLKAQW